MKKTEELIKQKLSETERAENVRILFAAESGSRAWGFASPDSDYDVRFIYARPTRDYLRIEEIRDVIELPISDSLDINGWDLKKALRLLYKSNPTIFEWLSSPTVYFETELAKSLRALTPDFFSAKKSLCHYIGMAERDFGKFLCGASAKVKSYFYVLRAVLACRWVAEKKTPPPMLFSELAAEELPTSLRGEVEGLLKLKISSPEVKEIPVIDSLNEFLDAEISDIRSKICLMEEKRNNGTERLNSVFMNAVKEMDWNE